MKLTKKQALTQGRKLLKKMKTLGWVLRVTSDRDDGWIYVLDLKVPPAGISVYSHELSKNKMGYFAVTSGIGINTASSMHFDPNQAIEEIMRLATLQQLRRQQALDSLQARLYPK